MGVQQDSHLPFNEVQQGVNLRFTLFAIIKEIGFAAFKGADDVSRKRRDLQVHPIETGMQRHVACVEKAAQTPVRFFLINDLKTAG